MKLMTVKLFLAMWLYLSTCQAPFICWIAGYFFMWLYCGLALCSMFILLLYLSFLSCWDLSDTYFKHSHNSYFFLEAFANGILACQSVVVFAESIFASMLKQFWNSPFNLLTTAADVSSSTKPESNWTVVLCGLFIAVHFRIGKAEQYINNVWQTVTTVVR